jgi:hypothetical protein
MDEWTRNLGDPFIFEFKPDGSLELVASGDITADNKRVTVDIARKLHRARVRNSLRVIRGGKSE